MTASGAPWRKKALFTAVLLIAAEPASAHCYSVWKFPWRQRCGAAVQVAARTPAREEPKPAPVLPPEPTPLNFVAPVIPPPPDSWDEETERAFAIKKLNEQIERRQPKGDAHGH